MTMRSVLPYLTAASLLLGATGCTMRPTSVGGDRPLNNASTYLWSISPPSTGQPSTAASWPDGVQRMAIALVDQAQPKTTAATLYMADGSCTAFESKTVELPPQDAIDHAISQLLATQSVKSIPLAGYRVEQRLSGTVRVDLRFAPDMTRSVYSLSNCEQFALFGSIRATLVQNPQWQVTQVIFTERGKELVL
jgi:hypothetical protein